MMDQVVNKVEARRTSVLIFWFGSTVFLLCMLKLIYTVFGIDRFEGCVCECV